MPMVSSAFRATAAPLIAGVLLLAPASTAPQARPAALDDATIVHVLDRTGFGARAEDVARVRELGLERYVDEQLHPEAVRRRDPRPARAVRDARDRPRHRRALREPRRAAARAAASPAAPVRGRASQQGAGEMPGNRRRSSGPAPRQPGGMPPVSSPASEREAGARSRACPGQAGRSARSGELLANLRPTAAARHGAAEAESAGAGRALRAEDPARRLLRAAARGSARRLLVQPLQRVRRQGSGARST